MIKFVLILALGTASVGCKITDKNEGREITSAMLENPTTMTFEEPTHDFGDISLGSEVSFTFKFTNTGESILVIHSVKAACGCTVLKDWPKQPIQPGESGEIPVVFNSKVAGKQKKRISIIANTRPSITEVYLTGTVIGPE